jgi:hypothetical protein
MESAALVAAEKAIAVRANCPTKRLNILPFPLNSTSRTWCSP